MTLYNNQLTNVSKWYTLQKGKHSQVQSPNHLLVHGGALSPMLRDTGFCISGARSRINRALPISDN
jgi:hypothetical protein